MNQPENHRDGVTRVLVVDDSAFYRQTFSNMLNHSEKIRVVGVAPNGVEAIRFLSSMKPDVIVLDLEMPEMDGFTFLRWLMSHNPLPVVIVSARSDMSNVFKALELGAVDFLAKPTPQASLEIMKIEKDLKSKVRLAQTITIDKLKIHKKQGAELSQAAPIEKKTPKWEHKKKESRIDIVTIGASTGGPPAIQTILARLPKDIPITIAVAQHMPPVFTKYFSERLDKVSAFSVREARHGETVEKGTAYIAPGGTHMIFKRSKGKTCITLEEESEEDIYIPSIDLLMKSVAEIYGPKALGIILTGMGQDGKKGLGYVKKKGGLTVAEDEGTSVVFGMPREAIKGNVVDKVLPLHKIAGEIVFRCAMG